MQTQDSGISPMSDKCTWLIPSISIRNSKTWRENISIIYMISTDKPFEEWQILAPFLTGNVFFFFFQNTMAKPALQKPVSHVVVKEPVVSPPREDDRKGSPYGQWVPVKKEEKKTFLNFSPKSSLFRARWWESLSDCSTSHPSVERWRFLMGLKIC